VSATGGVVTGTVGINGKCFQTTTESDSASFIPVATITIGQCYNLFQGGCQPQNCDNNSPGERCNRDVPDCTVYPPDRTVCSSTYTVVQGDFCAAIADSAGMTLAALQALNPDVDCETLQPFQELCLAQTTEPSGPGKTVCEGFKVSGRRLAARKMQQAV
jgi:LysM repeat protein